MPCTRCPDQFIDSIQVCRSCRHDQRGDKSRGSRPCTNRRTDLAWTGTHRAALLRFTRSTGGGGEIWPQTIASIVPDLHPRGQPKGGICERLQGDPHPSKDRTRPQTKSEDQRNATDTRGGIGGSRCRWPDAGGKAGAPRKENFNTWNRKWHGPMDEPRVCEGLAGATDRRSNSTGRKSGGPPSKRHPKKQRRKKKTRPLIHPL
ncbi:hypothetical protein POX_f07465 [Penicillium oxalicum]|uniref:hypothetical protein n=1 Tax=Penicillium oxalicum TaxID=69781 RepID=UPI0020B7751A|nr:hypothetical protein POX_f07465 [Penicillium oxalicum]KAI2787106.1 hypothetical protein POX_f07465 [Penicillium oxalicum]